MRLSIVGINEKAGEKMSVVLGASGNCSDDVSRNQVGGQGTCKKAIPVKIREDSAMHMDKVRTGNQ